MNRGVRLFGHLTCVDAQIQLEVDLREIEQRERGVIAVAGPLRRGGRRVEKLDGAAVLAAQVVEPRDVVVGLGDGLIEPAARGQLRAPIRRRRAPRGSR